ncbi:hypothetical protein OG342_35355 [Streptomyces bobili]|uniref:hypothetical protein n=1 Tax=Streptomyces bobili TaxID=67280 RepID=UPI00225BBFCC|nr:hypothetical protein [Streptomyces bobili]MCX5528078.1 hypothetical protein [Streptomyces bobili]
MGVYLVSIEAREWFGEDEGEGGHGAVASAFDGELRRRGLPPYEPGPGAGGSWFEEKVSPSMKGFDAFCRDRLTEAERDTFYGWTVLVPLSVEEPIRLPVGSAYADETVVAGAPQVLALGERLAGILGLPLDAIPATGANLELLLWFMEGDQVARTAAARPGPWAEDLDTAFYVALYLRAAQYALRYGCPVTYS